VEGDCGWLVPPIPSLIQSILGYLGLFAKVSVIDVLVVEVSNRDCRCSNRGVPLNSPLGLFLRGVVSVWITAYGRIPITCLVVCDRSTSLEGSKETWTEEHDASDFVSAFGRVCFVDFMCSRAKAFTSRGKKAFSLQSLQVYAIICFILSLAEDLLLPPG
jgi:hypothetical protein